MLYYTVNIGLPLYYYAATCISDYLLATNDRIICRVLVLDAHKLFNITLRCVNEIVKDWSENRPPDTVEMAYKHKHKVSCHASRNSRRKMEDRHLVVPLLRLFTDNKVFS